MLNTVVHRYCLWRTHRCTVFVARSAVASRSFSGGNDRQTWLDWTAGEFGESNSSVNEVDEISNLFKNRKSAQAHGETSEATSPKAMEAGHIISPPVHQRTSLLDVDDDDDRSSLLPTVLPAQVEVQQLLDDNFLYIPELHQSEDTAQAAAPDYVPGQPMVPVGMTRYRIDVQFQGADFNGWYASSKRYRVEERREEGRTFSVAVDAKAKNGGGKRMQEETHGLYFAKSALEDALAVALDTSVDIKVVSSVIPERGVSVRRLPCHVDLPSDIQLTPRIIIKRATMWLQQKQQPLAILCCHPCRNPHFHARHSGVRRVYCYRMLNRIAPPLFDAGFQWHVDRHLDEERMKRFAEQMEGNHDFGYFTDPKMANALRRAAISVPGRVTSAMNSESEPLTSLGLSPNERLIAPKVPFMKGLTQLERAKALPTFNEYGQTVKSYQGKPKVFSQAHTNLPTVRTVDSINVVRQEDEVIVWFTAQSFMRHQIRNMVSVLKAAGQGLWDEQELQHAFRSGFEPSRKKFQRERLPPAPAHGLILWDVEYPEENRDDYVPFVDNGEAEDDVELTDA